MEQRKHSAAEDASVKRGKNIGNAAKSGNADSAGKTVRTSKTGSIGTVNKSSGKSRRIGAINKSSTRSGSVGAANKSSGKGGKRGREKQEEEKKKQPWWIGFLLVAALLAAVLFLLRGCGKDFKDLILDMPEYEESVGYGGDGEGLESGDRIDLAVIPDFTVTKENPGFVIPYPENAYDVEFSFVDAESGEERYHTKRIKPGSIIEIPAFGFCDKGEHLYRIEVEVYDCDNYVELPSAVALEMKITKE